MANQHLNIIALPCSNVVFAAISGALGMIGAAGFGMLVVLNIAMTVGQGTCGLSDSWLEKVPVGTGVASPSS